MIEGGFSFYNCRRYVYIQRFTVSIRLCQSEEPLFAKFSFTAPLYCYFHSKWYRDGARTNSDSIWRALAIKWTISSSTLTNFIYVSHRENENRHLMYSLFESWIGRAQQQHHHQIIHTPAISFYPYVPATDVLHCIEKECSLCLALCIVVCVAIEMDTIVPNTNTHTQSHKHPSAPSNFANT